MLELLFYMAAEILGKEYVSLWCVLWYIFLCFDVDVIVIHVFIDYHLSGYGIKRLNRSCLALPYPRRYVS